MKTTKTSVVTKSVLALAAVASINAFAGPKSAPAPAACASCDNSAFSGSLSADFASDFLFRGLDLGRNVVSTNLNVSVPLAEGFSLSLGGSGVRGLGARAAGAFRWNTYSLGLNYDLGSVKVGLVYNQYDNVSGGNAGLNNSFNEVGLTAATSVGAFDFGAAVYQDLDADATYAQVSAGTSIDVTSSIKLVPSMVAGYGFSGYYGPAAAGNDGLTHVAANLAAPVKVTKNATLTPYASWNITGDQRAQNPHNSQLIGGVKFSVAF